MVITWSRDMRPATSVYRGGVDELLHCRCAISYFRLLSHSHLLHSFGNACLLAAHSHPNTLLMLNTTKTSISLSMFPEMTKSVAVYFK